MEVTDNVAIPPAQSAETRPADDPGGFSVNADTVLLQGGPDGKPIYEPISAGTRLVLAQTIPSGRPDDFVQVRTADGRSGSIPFGRLKLSVIVTEPKPIVATLRPHAPPLLPEANRTRDEVERAVKFLIARQDANGTWEHVPAPVPGAADPLDAGQWGFTSAIATSALLEVENSQRAEVKKALGALEKFENLSGTYAVAARCEAWTKVPPKHPDAKRIRELLKSDSDLLIKGARLGAGGRADYGYDLLHPNAGEADPLATMFAQRAVYRCSQREREVPAEYWKSLQAGWDADQVRAGGWSRWKGAGDSSALATLIGINAIEGMSPATGPGVACKGNVSTPTDLAWASLEKMKVNDLGPMKLSRGTLPVFKHLSSMLLINAACERGAQLLQGNGVFDEAVGRLITSQNADGSFAEGDGSSAVVDTALAVIALSAVRQPVVICKLADDRPDWNERPLDARRFAAFFGPMLCWSTGYSEQVQPDELSSVRGVPLLFISGSKAFTMRRAEERCLRMFVESGGLIFANPDCHSKEFTASVEKLGQDIFPEYKFRELPAEHPIFQRIFNAAKWRKSVKLRGLSNGVRELIVLNDDDMGRTWAAGETALHRESFELGANLVMYVKNNRVMSTPSIREVEQGQPRRNPTGVIRCARLIVGDNFDPEPYGWRRMQRIMNEECAQDLIVTPLVLGDRLSAVHVAHLTGTGKFELTESQRKAIADFVGGGGVLLIDAAGGSTEFANAALAELQQIFGPGGVKQLANPLSANHPIYQMQDHRIDRIDFTDASRSKGRKHNAPNLRGIDINGRTAVFFSEEDLSAALVGRTPAGVCGYETGSATAIVRNVLLYSLQAK